MSDEMSLPPPTGLSASVSVQVDSLVAGAAAQGHTPGLILGVTHFGRVIHITTAGSGLAPADQSRIGSISKTFTAVLLMQLRDEGSLDLDEPIDALLPGVDLPGVTPRNLLAHHSGLRREPSAAFTAGHSRDDPQRAWWERATGGDLAALLADVDATALIHRPFHAHHYSNLGYGLLGAVIEKVAGQSWLDALAQRVLAPLGLSRTTYHAIAPYAAGYVVNPLDGTLREEPRYDAGAMAPAGQLWSTVHDLARWAGFLASPDPSVLAPATMDEMCLPASMTDLNAWTGAHGLGIQLWRSGERVYAGHTGSMPGYLAALVTHRASNTAAVAFANAYTLVGGSLQDLALRVLDAVLDARPSVPPAQPTNRAVPTAPTAPTVPAETGATVPADVANLLGTWWWMGRRYDVIWDGELVITYRAESAERWRFTRSGVDRWRCHTGANDGETLIVRRADDGAAIGLDVATFYFIREPWPDLEN